MDKKYSLNLPQTGFPMKADLVAREPQRLEKWQSGRLYERIQSARQTSEKFVLHDGPPFANGDVHIGTALNKILKDIIVKYQTLRGKSAPYVPGWDCHGLPIESKVTQEMRISFESDWSRLRQNHQKSWENSEHPQLAEQAVKSVELREFMSPQNIRSACDAYARKYIDLQRTQFKRLGVLGDWENPYLTLNKEYEAEELRMFADIVEKGFVYRGKKPVYWSIPFKTALAEAEVEYNDHVSQSIYVKFPVVGRPNTFVLIWTTTPWTLPANLAVAFNPNLYYSQVTGPDGAYYIGNDLLGAVSQKLGWSYQINYTASPDELASLEYQHPFCNRTGKLYPADFVENSTGTGFVHIAPGHGMDDYHLGLKVGLPIYCPVTDDGLLAPTDDLPLDQQMPDSLIGKSVLEKNNRSDANDAVLALLMEKSVLAHREDYPHSYPHCWRSKTPIVFRAVDQWFIRIDHVANAEGGARNAESAGQTFRQQAIAEIDRVKWIPDWGVNRIKGAVQTRPDWCISRQRTWGVPIPAFYSADKNPILNADIIRNVATLIEQHGSNIWFARPVDELWATLKPKGWSGPNPVSKSHDTLDVWIDSGSSSRAVLMRRKELSHSTLRTPHSAVDWQADVYLEGSDQHRGWFQSSLLLSLAGNGSAPFKTVLTHGFMVDADREKISKSKQGAGGYEKPQTSEAYVKKYGADVVRLWVASQDYRSDIVVSEERINKVAETYRGIRNCLRYQLSNLYDFHPSHDGVADAALTGLDRWILGKFSELEKDVMAAYDAYEFHVVYQKISQFVAVELSAIYHDVVKDRLYTLAAKHPKRRSTQTALHRMVTGLCQMLSPMLAFTADEAWEFIPGVEVSVHESEFKSHGVAFSQDDEVVWAKFFETRSQVLPYLERERQAKTIGKALDAKVTLIAPEATGLALEKAHQEDLRELLNVSQLILHSESLPSINLGGAYHSKIEKADGQKCDRCWHWETDVGANPEYPLICGRCVEAEKANQPA